MTAIYTEIKNTAGEIQSIRRESDGACIPVCEENRDYIKYLADKAADVTIAVEVTPDPVPDNTISLENRIAALELAEIERELGL